ncbi:MAG TPA: hypothetical protein VI457_01850 [Methylococcaceae bacterium]|nr:hypothetical protein [Methylococcaceae bacterium]
MRAFIRPAALLALFVLPAAFADEAAPKAPAEVPAYNVNDYYQIHQDKRIHVFDDAGTFKEFLSSGESPYRLTRIGAGPKGETIVFGLRGMDKDKKEENIGGAALYDGKTQGASDSFFAVLMDDKRIHVFEDWAGFAAYRESGEAAFRYTDIGGGPNGQTVVYVFGKANKEKKPDEMVARFKSLYAR